VTAEYRVTPPPDCVIRDVRPDTRAPCAHSVRMLVSTSICIDMCDVSLHYVPYVIVEYPSVGKQFLLYITGYFLNISTSCHSQMIGLPCGDVYFKFQHSLIDLSLHPCAYL
jgi:hypothetical protein